MENLPNTFEGLSTEWFRRFAEQNLPVSNSNAIGARLAHQLIELRDVMFKVIRRDSRLSTSQSQVAAMRLFDATVRCVQVNIPLEFAREQYVMGLITDEELRRYEQADSRTTRGDCLPEVQPSLQTCQSTR
jgi:hypothetical protein